MTETKESNDTLLEKALDFIVEREEPNDFICEKLHDIASEFDVCVKNCENLTKYCVLRYLQHYEKGKG